MSLSKSEPPRLLIVSSVEDSERKIMLLIPKNWAVFQHYKDRCPPWIKLHRDLLNNRDFMCLPLASKALAPMLWLLAAEAKDGIFDANSDELTFRLRITPKELTDGLKPLIDKGFFLIASGVLAECYQGAIPETETERETKKKTYTPEGVSQFVWQDFVKHRKTKKAAISELVIKGIQKEADKAGITLEEALTETIVRGWISFKADWFVKPSQSAQQETFKERDARLGRERWEEMTGRSHPDNKLTYIDAPSRNILEITND